MLQDEDVIRLVLSGQIDAYTILIDKYKNMIFDMCFKYTYDYSEAQDLSQEVFLKTYRKLGSFKNSSSFSTWLYRIAVNICIDWTRSSKKHKNVTLMDGVGYIDQIPSLEPMPEDIVTEDEKREYVRKIVLGLPEKYRMVIILYNYQDLSVSEISEILKIPLKTIETRLYRAKKLLKDMLFKSYGGGEYSWNAAK